MTVRRGAPPAVLATILAMLSCAFAGCPAQAARPGAVNAARPGAVNAARPGAVNAARPNPADGARPALAQGEGSISGKVTAQVGKEPAHGVEVCAAPEGTPAVELRFFRNCEQTNVTGEYTIEHLAAGKWIVEFNASRSEFNLLRQYYNARTKLSQADPVTVSAGATTTGINAEMPPGAQISGRVSAADTAASVAGALVCAIAVDALEEEPECGLTDANGEYTISSLETSSYAVYVNSRTPSYPSGFYKATASVTPSLGEATPVQTTAGLKTPGVDMVLPQGGTIEGQVVDARTRSPLAGVGVCYESLGGEPPPRLLSVFPCVETEADGSYRLTGLAAGQYRVFAQGPLTYAPQVYSGKYELFEGKVIAVSGGASTNGVDFALTLGGTISGRVTSAVTKVGVKEVDVCLNGPSGGVGSCTSTNSNGEYTQDGLAPGTYTIEFRPPFGSEYAAQFYNGKTTFEEADAVTVGEGATLTHLDATLQVGGSISGLVTAAAGGAPIADAEVCAWFTSEEEIATCTGTEASGSYLLRGLPSGQYKLEFGLEFDSLTSNFVGQFFNAKASYGEADTVTVNATDTTANVNAALGQGGEIQGTITDGETGLPLFGFEACAFDGQGSVVRCAESEPDGTYTIRGLPSGDYAVRFEPTSFGQTRFATQFYTEVGSIDSAAPVGVLAGAPAVTEIDAVVTATSRPVARGGPFVSGATKVGSTLREFHGDWFNGVTSFAYQWERCGADRHTCAAIAGATGRSYLLTGADEGHTIRVRETATNEHGAGQSEVSALTSAVPTVSPTPPGSPTPPPGSPGSGGGSGGSGNSQSGSTSSSGSPQPTGQSTPQGQVLSSTATLPSAGQIVHALLAALAPAGRGARIAALRKHASYPLTFAAPAAGAVTIAWYEAPAGAHLSAARPILIASAHASATKAGKVKLTVKLNAKGRALLRHASRVKVTAKGSFTPAGGATVSASKSFTLH